MTENNSLKELDWLTGLMMSNQFSCNYSIPSRLVEKELESNMTLQLQLILKSRKSNHSKWGQFQSQNSLLIRRKLNKTLLKVKISLQSLKGKTDPDSSSEKAIEAVKMTHSTRRVYKSEAKIVLVDSEQD